jgi:AcrR family transcriptional regulator
MRSLRHFHKRKQEILLAAAKLFREKTFLGTTLDEVASKVNINKATIYFYFKSKEQLLYEIVAGALEELIKNAQAIISTDASPIEKMESLIRLHLRIGTRSNNLNGVSQFERRNLSPKLLKQYNAQRDRYQQIYSDLLREGMAINQFRRGDPSMMSRLILSLANSTITWFKKTGPLSIEQIADETWKFVSRSLQNFQ